MSPYGVVIVGPAGLTAGLYAGRARLRTLILDQGEAHRFLSTSPAGKVVLVP